MKALIILSIISLSACSWLGYNPTTSELNDRKCALKYPKHDKTFCPKGWNGFIEER